MESKGKIIILVVICCILIIISICYMHGCLLQSKLPDGQVKFVSVYNKDIEINSVLVIPIYYVSSGIFVSTRMGEGPYISKMHKSFLLAHPFIHKSDSPKFVLEQPLSNVIGISPWVAVGTKTVEISGAIAIAKGYKPEEIELRFFLERPSTYGLTPIDEKQTKEVLSRISEGIHNKQYEVLWTNDYIPPKDCPIKYDFTKKEWGMIEKFINDAEANLP